MRIVMTMNVPQKGFTHGGKFHADDVFSTALLKILNPEFTKLAVGFVFDPSAPYQTYWAQYFSTY